MTLSEAIKHCEEVAYQKDLESGFDTDNERYAMTDKEKTDCKECANEHRQLAEWLKELKRFREQAPCEDCISRTETVQFLENHLKDFEDVKVRMAFRAASSLINNPENLPPVKPQPKTGHWKFVQRGKYIDICCPNCGYQRVKEYAYNYTVDQISEQDKKDFFSNSNMNFCEKCGAKLESER